MPVNSIYRTSKKITHNKLGACEVYYMNPGTIEKKHFHDGIEIVYVMKGNSKTHKQGQVYVYQKGQVHEVVNDSHEELILVCLTIPPESKENTHFL